MTRENSRRYSTSSAGQAAAEVQDLAAELTEAAFPVALRHGIGTDWLDRKLDLWNAMTRTVNEWRHADHPLYA